MGHGPTIYHKLTAHRVAAVESATNADIHRIIEHTRKVMDHSREAMRRVDALLRAQPAPGDHLSK